MSIFIFEMDKTFERSFCGEALSCPGSIQKGRDGDWKYNGLRQLQCISIHVSK